MGLATHFFLGLRNIVFVLTCKKEEDRKLTLVSPNHLLPLSRYVHPFAGPCDDGFFGLLAVKRFF